MHNEECPLFIDCYCCVLWIVKKCQSHVMKSGIPYVEISALLGTNITDAFRQLAALALRLILP